MAVLHKCRPFIAEGHGINNGSSAPRVLVPSAWNLPENMFRTKGVVMWQLQLIAYGEPSVYKLTHE
jgi:hypothetical protein